MHLQQNCPLPSGMHTSTFNRTETCRVFLVNAKLAAHGLHLAAASRVFFINPIWQPNVESQAIKRVHRIGQTRSVYVGTLILKETLEDQMLRRRKRMTTTEHQTAKKSFLDDPLMLQITQDARIPIRMLIQTLLRSYSRCGISGNASAMLNVR